MVTDPHIASTETAAESAVWELLNQVTDPEIPVLSIVDLGIVREVVVAVLPNQEKTANIAITPTYSGCPAMDMITVQIRMALLQAGYTHINIKTVLSPAWTTDWMSEEGRQKLLAYGIAPPNAVQQVCTHQMFAADEAVQCPQCRSWNTRRLSEFGSTACKALYQCNDCLEPFDYFKCH